MKNNSKKTYQVRVMATYETFVNILADSGKDAEETVQMLLDNGDIDAVTFCGTVKSGGFTGKAELIGPTKLKPTYPTKHKQG